MTKLKDLKPAKLLLRICYHPGKKRYDQPIVSNIKRYEEVKILTTGQGEDYTTA